LRDTGRHEPQCQRPPESEEQPVREGKSKHSSHAMGQTLIRPAPSSCVLGHTAPLRQAHIPEHSLRGADLGLLALESQTGGPEEVYGVAQLFPTNTEGIAKARRDEAGKDVTGGI